MRDPSNTSRGELGIYLLVECADFPGVPAAYPLRPRRGGSVDERIAGEGVWAVQVPDREVLGFHASSPGDGWNRFLLEAEATNRNETRYGE